MCGSPGTVAPVHRSLAGRSVRLYFPTTIPQSPPRLPTQPSSPCTSLSSTSCTSLLHSPSSPSTSSYFQQHQPSWVSSPSPSPKKSPDPDETRLDLSESPDCDNFTPLHTSTPRKSPDPDETSWSSPLHHDNPLTLMRRGWSSPQNLNNPPTLTRRGWSSPLHPKNPLTLTRQGWSSPPHPNNPLTLTRRGWSSPPHPNKPLILTPTRRGQSSQPDNPLTLMRRGWSSLHLQTRPLCSLPHLDSSTVQNFSNSPFSFSLLTVSFETTTTTKYTLLQCNTTHLRNCILTYLCILYPYFSLPPETTSRLFPSVFWNCILSLHILCVCRHILTLLFCVAEISDSTCVLHHR